MSGSVRITTVVVGALFLVALPSFATAPAAGQAEKINGMTVSTPRGPSGSFGRLVMPSPAGGGIGLDVFDGIKVHN